MSFFTTLIILLLRQLSHIQILLYLLEKCTEAAPEKLNEMAETTKSFVNEQKY
jgi:hypothetical protein